MGCAIGAYYPVMLHDGENYADRIAEGMADYLKRFGMRPPEIRVSERTRRDVTDCVNVNNLASLARIPPSPWHSYDARLTYQGVPITANASVADKVLLFMMEDDWYENYPPSDPHGLQVT